jgi:hypothetical protein
LKTVALTFDDGPHPRYTDQVLAILKKYGLHAVFFEIGKNLGTTNDNKRSDTRSDIRSQLPRFSNQARLSAITRIAILCFPSSIRLIWPGDRFHQRASDVRSEIAAGALPPSLRRGERKHSGRIQADNMKTVIWNVDSEDWADPVPNSVAQRVITEVEKQQRGIILFHDIHKVGVDALPTVIETLQADGYKFVSWNGTAFHPRRARGRQPEVVAAPPPAQPYHDSWAAIIGIDDYVNWQKLQYAAHDAQGVKDAADSEIQLQAGPRVYAC